MDTELRIPKGIEKLLREGTLEDRIVGIEYIYGNYGKEGIEKTFDRSRYSSRNTAKYRTYAKNYGALVIYDDTNIWIGPGWIEYDRDLETIAGNEFLTINNKTKQL